MNLIRLQVLAEHFEEIGDYEMAESFVRQIVDIKEMQYGLFASELITDLHNLALLLETQENRTEALRTAKRAYKIGKINNSVDLDEIRDFIDELCVPSIA